jgi:hypothetical protein
VSAGTGNDAGQAQPGPGERRRRGARWKLILAVLVSAYVLLGGYALVSASASGALGSNGLASASTAVSPAARSAAAPAPAIPPILPQLASAPAPHALTVASVAAFGPEGTADGDNPGIVSRVDAGGAQPWYSSWYATPEFGDLQSGTGLLLDMGSPVTVSGVRLSLGGQPGADVQVRIGNSPVLDGLTPVASAVDVGTAVQLSVTPSSTGRYVLVWFTRLPPNLQGEYQVGVYGVTVDGTDL